MNCKSNAVSRPMWTITQYIHKFHRQTRQSVNWIHPTAQVIARDRLRGICLHIVSLCGDSILD